MMWVDTKERTMALKTKSALEMQVKVTMASTKSPEHGVFGKGTVTLLHGVERTGSLNRAAKDLGMAYSKAWTMMRDVEANFGVKLIDRDGARGSTITEDGQKLIDIYDKVAKDTAAFASKLFEKELAKKQA
jgi:molybdate transport system regulatory protein